MRRVAALLLLAAAARGDLLIQRDGTELLGDLVTLGKEQVRFRLEDGEVRELARAAVARLELHRDLSGTRARTVADLADPAVDRALALVAGPATYPSAGAVNLYLGETVTFHANGHTTRTVRNIVRVLRERGKSEGTVPARWLRDLERYQLDHARTYVPRPGGGYDVRGLTDKGVRIAPVHGGTPEYDRQMQALHTLPAVDVGVVVDWQYTVERLRLDPAMPEYFSQVVDLGEPVLEGELVLRVHPDSGVEVELTRTEGVARSRTSEGEFLVERFVYRGREPARRERSKPPPAEIHPAVFAAPRATWAEVAASVREAFAPPASPGPRAKALLDELIRPEMSPARRYEALAMWVAREVRLVGILMRDVSHHPRDLEEVLATRTGNYLDKSWALFALLRLAGVDAELYLGRDRYAGNFPPGTVSLRLFNDALLRVPLDEARVFRDADDVDLGPHDLPAAFYGTRALRVAGGVPATGLDEIPAPPLEVDRQRAIYATRLDAAGTLRGTRTLEVRGNKARTVRGYRNQSKEDLRKRQEALNHAFHPQAILVGYSLENLGDFTEDVLYTREFEVPGYALRAGEDLQAFRMPGLAESSGDVGRPVRRFPLAFIDQDLEERDITVALPAGMRVVHLPAGLDLAGDGWAYRSSFTREAGGVRFTSRYVRTTPRVEPDAYPAYKEMRDRRAREAREWVVVERPAGSR